MSGGGGMKRALRQLTFGTGKTAGRNSSGRITSFHRGGGAKRSQRTIDLKRNTSSSLGVVERIEYDPNRSSRIALVRWLNGIRPPKPEPKPISGPIYSTSPSHRYLSFDPSSTEDDGSDNNVRGVFALKPVLQVTSTYFGNILQSYKPFSNLEKKGRCKVVSKSLGVPRIAVAAARPDFFATQEQWMMKSSTMEVRNWKKNSDVWKHRNKRKAAISWHTDL